MRIASLIRGTALLSAVGLLSACPKKDNDVAPEPATPSAVEATDKAGAAPPAEASEKKKDDDKGGW